ncbi:protein mono-ADP-ribosyltransferase PARP12-like [Trichomycterus rosablanca]|uniref:protein mono-ADP-ribosyltransferase PARP12-like n=1 Tax=Trichomycterus rosablanca TaxID=2290929 RepID=UPI002F359944
MATVVTGQLMRIVLENWGSLEFRELSRMFGRIHSMPDQDLLALISSSSQFIVVENSKRDSASASASETLVIAKTTLRLCPNNSDCGNCEHLQICKFFVCGTCKFGHKCKTSHDLKSAHNALLLRKMGLQDLKEKELFQLLLQNDPTLLPEACSHYNKGNGEHGSCKFNTSCINLHICQHFLQDDCKFGTKCKRAHNFDTNSLKVLRHGISEDNIQEFLKTYKNKYLITCHKDKPARRTQTVCAAKPTARTKTASSSSVSEEDAEEICLYFIRRGCTYKEKCIRVHHNLPYKWQSSCNGSWKDLSHEEEIEKAYCDPAKDKGPGIFSVNFSSMTRQGLPVRRLSTPSSVTKPPHFLLTTEWLWYWKDDLGQWIEYGQGMDKKHGTPLTSQTIENIYQSDPESDIPVSSPKHAYVLYLKDMYQQNTVYKTKREIRRRPRFVSASEVKSKLKSETSSSSSSSVSDVVPAHWDKGALPSYSYKLVSLSRAESDYQKVEKLFKMTMPNYTIVKMQRNQNVSLWKVFQWQKEQMKVRNGGAEVNEKLLFHGTNQSLIDPICEQNFDWRICGKHGTSYGKGSYFATDASYSDRYSDSVNNKMMFVARVLVGSYTYGNSSMVRPPAKTTGKDLYDSCVNNISDPSIFVIFEKHQIYPEFIIEYCRPGTAVLNLQSFKSVRQISAARAFI